MPHIHEKIDYAADGFVVYQGKVLLILHKQLKLWLAPGGHIELHEDPEEAVLREIKEECGLEVEIIGEKLPRLSKESKPLYSPAFMDIHEISPTHRHIGFHYFCRATTNQVTRQENEIDDARWYTAEDLQHLENLKPETRHYAQEALRRLTK